MVLSAQEQKRREEIERAWKAAEALYHDRCAVVYRHTEAQRKVVTRAGTDKAAAAQREFQDLRGEAEKWREKQRKQIEREFSSKLDSMGADKHRVCLAIEEEIVQQLRVIEDEERGAILPLEVEREAAHQRYRTLLDPPPAPVAPIESEAVRDEQ
jgi:hypothetical protein